MLYFCGVAHVLAKINSCCSYLPCSCLLHLCCGHCLLLVWHHSWRTLLHGLSHGYLLLRAGDGLALNLWAWHSVCIHLGQSSLLCSILLSVQCRVYMYVRICGDHHSSSSSGQTQIQTQISRQTRHHPHHFPFPRGKLADFFLNVARYPSMRDR